MNQVFDVAGLHDKRHQFFPQQCEYDTIIKKTLVVVKNVNCGLNSVESGLSNYKFAKDTPYSVSIPEKVCFTGFTKPDLDDGGYQHPLCEDWIDEVGKKATNNGSRYGNDRQYGATWDSPNTSGKRNLRYTFKTQKQAEKFIKLIKGVVQSQ